MGRTSFDSFPAQGFVNTPHVWRNEMNDDALTITGSVWLHRGDASLGGQARIGLLEQIDTHGSITAAAKAAGMSYKAAWDAVDAMNNLAGEPLVARSTGGRGGGGTTLTERGARLVAAFRAIESAQQQFLARLAGDLEHFDEQWRVLARLGLQTSARNQWYGRITAIRSIGINDEVTLTLPGGDTIVATLTHESTQTLGLAVGREAFALIKAPWVSIARGDAVEKLPAPNRLTGTIEAMTDDTAECEVIVALSGGASVAAVIPAQLAREQGLAQGLTVTAGFATSSVILGVQA